MIRSVSICRLNILRQIDEGSFPKLPIKLYVHGADFVILIPNIMKNMNTLFYLMSFVKNTYFVTDAISRMYL